jgi:hypothetical protein
MEKSSPSLEAVKAKAAEAIGAGGSFLLFNPETQEIEIIPSELTSSIAEKILNGETNFTTHETNFMNGLVLFLGGKLD